MPGREVSTQKDKQKKRTKKLTDEKALGRSNKIVSQQQKKYTKYTLNRPGKEAKPSSFFFGGKRTKIGGSIR